MLSDLPNGNPILYLRGRMASHITTYGHLCSYEKQAQTDGSNYRGLKRNWARFDQRIPLGGF